MIFQETILKLENADMNNDQIIRTVRHKDQVHFLVQSILGYTVSKLVTIIKSRV